MRQMYNAVYKCASALARTLDTGHGSTHPRETSYLTGFWAWRGYRIRYQRSGSSGPPALMVHGFGGNWSAAL